MYLPRGRTLLCIGVLVAIVQIASSAGGDGVSRAPVFRWAQDSQNVYLRIILSNVRNEKVTHTGGRTVTLECESGGEEYRLHLELYGKVNSKKTVVNTGSRETSLVITKAGGGKWERLLQSTEKMPNMKVDWTREVHEDSDADSEEMAAPTASKKAPKKKAKKAATLEDGSDTTDWKEKLNSQLQSADEFFNFKASWAIGKFYALSRKHPYVIVALNVFAATLALLTVWVVCCANPKDFASQRHGGGRKLGKRD